MHGTRRLVAALALLALTASACSSGTAPQWTFGAPATAAPAGIDQPTGTQGTAQAAAATSIEIEAFDMGFKPALVSVPAAGTYAVTFRNTGTIQHNLTFADGTVLTADAGQSATAQVTIPAGGLPFVCTIPGHAAAGMTGQVSVAADGSAMPGMSAAPAASAAPAGSTASAPVADPNAPAYVLRDPTVPPLLPGTVHDIDFPIIEKDMTVADGFVVHVWTFGGTVPGPVIHRPGR